jgi:hypothetical protein
MYNNSILRFILGVFPVILLPPTIHSVCINKSIAVTRELIAPAKNKEIPIFFKNLPVNLFAIGTTAIERIAIEKEIPSISIHNHYFYLCDMTSNYFLSIPKPTVFRTPLETPIILLTSAIQSDPFSEGFPYMFL